MKEITIRKVKLKSDGSVQLMYDQTPDGESVVNKIVLDGGHKSHEDFVNALDGLRVHLMLICEQAKTGTSKIIDSIKVTGYVIGGDNGDDEGVTLIGQRTLAGNKVLNLISPFTKLNDESPEYAMLNDLAADLQSCEAEALEYLEGKHAPEPVQTEMDFDGENKE